MFSDFTSNSTVHGVRYLGERRRHWSERVFWIIVFLISITLCSFVIVNMFDKWQQNPIISTIKETAPFDIPHPAITICPQVKVNRKYLNFKKVQNVLYERYLNDPYNITTEEHLRFKVLSQVCKGSSILVDNITIDSDQIVSTLQHFSQQLEETLFLCVFQNMGMNLQGCKTNLTEKMTEEGNCFTFNMLNSSEIFRDNV